MRPTIDLSGEVALVTGASRGIGQAVARLIADAGAAVVGTATSQPGADAITGYLVDRGGEGCGMCLDVTERGSVEPLLSAIKERFGAVSILVNNAGITRDGLALRMNDESWDNVVDTDLSAPFRLARGCLRDMMRLRKGRIINIGSVVASTGNAGQANYAAAKAGLEGMTRALAREVAARGITVNTVAPGFIETDMTRELTDAQADALKAQIPTGRFGEADDIAWAVTFLASAAGRYITGQTLRVNGGMFMA